jgi:CBS domain containing-hemolysin-like protein
VAGDIPQKGALIALDGLSFVVREVEENRIAWVEFVPPREE